MKEIIQVESSARLYRLISQENLHLRRGHGRDDALLRQLAKKLDLDPSKPVPKQLESKRISVEEFIQAFFSLAEPFAKMLSNIYSIMQNHQARRSKHSIRMRFSFQKISEKLDFDLKHFREWLETYRRLQRDLTVRLWSSNDIGKLFHPISVLRGVFGEHGDWIRSYSSPLPDPPILYADPQWRPMRKLRDSMEQLRQIASEETDEHVKAISVLADARNENGEMIELDPSKVRSMLSDLWPGLFRLLSQLERSTPPKRLGQTATNALQEIDRTLSEIRRVRMDCEMMVRELVELLRLPFWKHRWHVYEVWVMFVVIDCLDDYNATLGLVGDRLAIEEYKPTVVAQFEDLNGIRYEIWTQLSTPVKTPHNRKNIMPDIRLCKGDASSSENTFLIVECKQRRAMGPKSLEDLIEDYTRGTSKSFLNLFVNYDIFPEISSIGKFPRTKLLSNVNPAHPLIVDEFRTLIKEALVRNGIDPSALKFDAILFDVSISMRGRYSDSQIGKACEDLLGENPHSKIFFFSGNFLPIKRLPTSVLASKLEEMISGSTNLDGALRQLHTRHSNVRRVAVVTDGDYDDPIRSDDLFEVVEELVLGRNFPVEGKKR